MDDTQTDQKMKKDRSAAYPSIALQLALEYSAKLVEAYRKTPFSRENAVKGFGYNKITGDTGQKVAALVHYGLLTKDGNTYRNTELSQRICYASSDEDRAKDIATAAQSPKLFRKLIDDYAGQSLPSRLSNILIQSHEIMPTVSEKVAENFKATLTHANLLHNGVVSDVAKSNAEKAVTMGATRISPTQDPSENRGRRDTHPTPPNTQSLTLPSGLVLMYPVEMAYQFAIGKFAAQITALDEAIAASKSTPNNDSGTDATLAVE